ncbi:hypothetical protein V8G61_10300 [Gaetbulibacter sp. M240]|uniref:hypothetical protein n=1 Tax=Gaetbulibacter sp. M240 TaxID=3126511 RepID=UPI00374E5E1F
MATVTTSILAGGLAAGQAVSGMIDKKKAKDELANLETPELDNVFEDIRISTIGSDLIKEEASRTSANTIDAIRSGGARSIIGALPGVVAQNNRINQDSQLYLDDQVNKRQYAVAQDDARIRSMEENRYLGDVQGLNNRIQEGRQNVWSGLRGFLGAAAYAERAGVFDKTEDK